MARQKKPRIAEEDYLDLQAIAAGFHNGEWVRTPMSQKGHMIGNNPEMARCGFTILPAPEWWEKWQAFMSKWYDMDPGPYYVAVDRRKPEGNQCGICKGALDRSLDKDTVVISQKKASTFRQPVGTLTPSERLQRRRFDMAVTRVARELGATIETETETDEETG